jgi:hypothetical protein
MLLFMLRELIILAAIMSFARLLGGGTKDNGRQKAILVESECLLSSFVLGVPAFYYAAMHHCLC